MSKRSNFGWLELILGILLIVLGVFTFASPQTALAGAVFVYGIVAILTGIADIVFYVKLERRTGFGPVLTFAAGILSIIAGILLLVNPAAGAWALSILFPIWFIAHCIARLCNLGFTRMAGGTAPFVISLATGILGLVLGVALLLNPLASALSLAYIIGFYLLPLGIGSIVMAFSRLGARK